MVVTMTTTAPLTLIKALTISGDLQLESSINECILSTTQQSNFFAILTSLFLLLKHKMKCCLGAFLQHLGTKVVRT